MLESEFFGESLEFVTDELRTVTRSQDRGNALLGEQVLEFLDNGVSLSGAQFEHEWVLGVVIDYYEVLSIRAATNVRTFDYYSFEIFTNELFLRTNVRCARWSIFGSHIAERSFGRPRAWEPWMHGAACMALQCIQAKISKTLDKRSTLIFAANCTEQKLSSSESYYLTPNL